MRLLGMMGPEEKISPAVLDLTSLTEFHPPPNLEELLSEDWRKTNGERKESALRR